jgi:AcrR family transcriptional regulator
MPRVRPRWPTRSRSWSPRRSCGRPLTRFRRAAVLTFVPHNVADCSATATTAVRLHCVTSRLKNSTPLQQQRILDTQRRIIDAARQLFVEHGYAATTLTAVADAAGVGHRTVYLRFGTKAELLKRVIDVAIVGDTQDIALQQRDWFQQTLTADTIDERVDRMTKGSAQLMARAGELIAVAQQAESTEPVIASAGLAGRAATRDSVKVFVTSLLADGLLPRHSDSDWLIDTASVLVQAETYLMLRELNRWNSKRYERWLNQTLKRLIGASVGRGSRSPAN